MSLGLRVDIGITGAHRVRIRNDAGLLLRKSHLRLRFHGSKSRFLLALTVKSSIWAPVTI